MFFYLMYLIIGQHEILFDAAAVLVPFAIGAGLLIDAPINARALETDATTDN